MNKTLQNDIQQKYTTAFYLKGGGWNPRYVEYQKWCKEHKRPCILLTSDLRKPSYKQLIVETLPWWISLAGQREIWKLRYKGTEVFRLIGTFGVTNDSLYFHEMKREEALTLIPVIYDILSKHLLEVPDAQDIIHRTVNGYFQDIWNGRLSIDEAFDLAAETQQKHQKKEA